MHTVSTENFEHAVGNTHRLFAQVFAVCGETHDGLARVDLSLGAIDDAFTLHALNERRHRVGFKRQTLGNVIHGQFVGFPQHHQDQILGIGHTEFVQIGAIGLRDESAGSVEAKAKLLV